MRFQKCLVIGMEKSWVMTEGERLQMIKLRQEKKQRQDKLNENFGGKNLSSNEKPISLFVNGYEPNLENLNKFLTRDEVALLETFINDYMSCCAEIPFNPDLRQSTFTSRSRTEILDIFITAIQQFTTFAQRLKCFNVISGDDQAILLRYGVLELCFLRSAYIFDQQTSSWPWSPNFSHLSPAPFSPSSSSSSSSYSSSFSSSLSSSPLSQSTIDQSNILLSAFDLRPLISDELFDKQLNFVRQLKEIDIDECSVMILSLIVLLSPDRPGLREPLLITTQQERYLFLLRNYLEWRFGRDQAAHLHAKLLLTLPDLRELSETHSDLSLFICKEEVNEIQNRLVNLQIDGFRPEMTIPWSMKSIFGQRIGVQIEPTDEYNVDFKCS